VFPALRGGYLDLHNFRIREWMPAQRELGTDPVRRIYGLRHSFATSALRAGISTFDLSRYMGASLTTIDRHYGHLAKDGRQHAINLLETFTAAAPSTSTTVDVVDVRWTPTERHVSDHAPGNRETSPEQGETPNEALCRTRTDDPFLTMEVLYQLS
jgi:hypothetical protein